MPWLHLLQSQMSPAIPELPSLDLESLRPIFPTVFALPLYSVSFSGYSVPVGAHPFSSSSCYLLQEYVAGAGVARLCLVLLHSIKNTLRPINILLIQGSISTFHRTQKSSENVVSYAKFTPFCFPIICKLFIRGFSTCVKNLHHVKLWIFFSQNEALKK
jgi:uncharacterized membrane protein